MPHLLTSLRFRLILIVLLAVLPALALILYTGLEQHRLSNSEAQDDLLRTVRLISKDQENMLSVTRQLLATLAGLPAVRNRVECSAIFTDMLHEYPLLTNLGVVDTDGSFICSAAPFSGGIDVSEGSIFQQAVQSGRFAVGDFRVGCTPRGACINMAYPARDNTGKVHAVLYASLDMSWFANLATDEGLPHGSTFTIIDRKGTILTRYPEPEQWVGKTVPDTDIVRIILERGAGVTEALDIDGTLKVCAFTPLTGGLQEGFMYAGIPSETVFGMSDHALRRNLIALAGITLLVLVIGWMLDQVFVLRRIENLIGATRRLAVGEWNARTDLICDRGELGQLACSLDVLAENLRSREAERDQAQNNLQETLQTLRTIIEASPAAIIALSPSGHVRMWNPAAQHLFGWSEEEAIGIVIPILAAEKGEALRLLQEHVFTGRTLSGLDLTLQRKDGSSLDVSLSAGPLRDTEGNLSGAVAIFLDITERRQAIEALRKAHDELELRVAQRTADLTKLNEELRGEIARREDTEAALHKSSEALKFFAYSVIHDLKSPAIGMHGLTRLLRKQYGDRLDERGKKYCEQILTASEHFAALIEKINSYIAAKEASLKMESVNLQEIFKILWDEFALRLRVHEIAWHEPSDPIKIKADRISVLRVLRNLLDNSLKYGGEQLTEIRLGYEQSAEFHILSLSDNGVGISGENREKIFGIFQRHGAPEGVEGAGLGLAIVKEIAERHGGRAWVESGTEGGTTFSISISKDI